MRIYKGTGVSPGAAVGQLYFMVKQSVVPEKRTGLDCGRERDRFFRSREAVANELLRIAGNAMTDSSDSERGNSERSNSERGNNKRGNNERGNNERGNNERGNNERSNSERDIFVAQSRIARDRTLERETLLLIDSEGASAEWALFLASKKLAKKLDSVGDKLISARADDIRDVSGRIIKALMGVSDDVAEIPDNAIVVAEELLPSDTAVLPGEKVIGFVTVKGGYTSHVAIIARALEIPAVVNISAGSMAGGAIIAIDGGTGDVTVDPDLETLNDFNMRIAQYCTEKQKTRLFRSRETITADGQKRLVEANIGSLADLVLAIENGCEGVGLLRTEFFFMDSKRLPDEQEQFKVYSVLAEQLGGKPLIIRTLDIGGDKPVDYLDISKESNPFLGLRAIRHSLKHKDIFTVQVRAILRAGAVGRVELMLPMITTLSELLEAKQLISEAADDLRSEGIPYKNVPVGIMIEVPAAAIMADVLAANCDFFSIGTNDLIQYVTSADRGNSSVAHLYSMYEPSVLRLINFVIQSAHNQGIPCGMCGEAAACLPIVPLLAAMGLDSFSVSPSLITSVRAALCSVDLSGKDANIERLLKFRCAAEAEKALNE